MLFRFVVASVFAMVCFWPPVLRAGRAVACITTDGVTVNYGTVQDALDEVEDGGTVRLLSNVSECPLYAMAECSLDLNGFTLTGVILPDFDFTVLDSSGNDSGKIILPVLEEDDDVEGEVFLDGAVWAGYGIGTVTIGGGTYNCPAVVLWNSEASVSITSGVFCGAAVVTDTEWAEDFSADDPYDLEASVRVSGGRFSTAASDRFLIRSAPEYKGVALSVSGGCLATFDGCEAQHIDMGLVNLTGGCYSQRPLADFIAEDYVVAENVDADTKDDYPWTLKAASTEAFITAIEVDESTSTAKISVRLPDGRDGGVVKVWAKVNYTDRFWSQVGEVNATSAAVDVEGAQMLYYTVFTATVGANVQSGASLKGGNVVGTLKVAIADNEDCLVSVPYSAIGESVGGITLAELFQVSSLKDGDLVRVFASSGAVQGYKWNSPGRVWNHCAYDPKTRAWNRVGEDDAGGLNIGGAGVFAFYRAGGGSIRINGEVREWKSAQPWADRTEWAAQLDSGDGWNPVRGLNPSAVNVQDIPYLGLGESDTLWVTAADGVLRELKWDGGQWYYMKPSAEGGWGRTDTKVTGISIQAGSAFWYVNER